MIPNLLDWLLAHAVDIEEGATETLQPLRGDRCMLDEEENLLEAIENTKRMLARALPEAKERIQHILRAELLELFLIENPEVEFVSHLGEFQLVEESDRVLFKLKYSGPGSFPPTMTDEH
jgi:hypothetical protein